MKILLFTIVLSSSSHSTVTALISSRPSFNYTELIEEMTEQMKTRLVGGQRSGRCLFRFEDFHESARRQTEIVTGVSPWNCPQTYCLYFVTK